MTTTSIRKKLKLSSGLIAILLVFSVVGVGLAWIWHTRTLTTEYDYELQVPFNVKFVDPNQLLDDTKTTFADFTETTKGYYTTEYDASRFEWIGTILEDEALCYFFIIENNGATNIIMSQTEIEDTFITPEMDGMVSSFSIAIDRLSNADGKSGFSYDPPVDLATLLIPLDWETGYVHFYVIMFTYNNLNNGIAKQTYTTADYNPDMSVHYTQTQQFDFDDGST